MGGKCASIFKFSAMCQIFAKSDHTVHFRKYSLPPSEEIWQKEVLKFSTSADLSVFILIDGANAIYQISGSAIELQRHYEWLNWLCLSEPLHSGWLKTKWMKRPLLNLIIQRSSIITYLCVFDILDKCHQNRIFVIHLTYIFKLGWQNGQVDHCAV